MAISTETGSPRTSAPPAAPKRRKVNSKYVYGTCAVLAAVVLWEVVAALRVRPAIVLPGPADVVKAFQQLFSTSEIWGDLATSGRELLFGLALATVVGLPVGLVIGWYRRLSYILNPFVSFLYATPRIALTPLLIIWLGIGDTSKIAIVFLMAVFPILINAATGMQSLDPAVVRVARCFGGKDLQIFRTIALPGTVPFVISGLRLAVGQALIGVFVAELSGAQSGVGMLMNNAGQQFQTSVVFAGLFIFALTGVVLNGLLRRVERHFDSWRSSNH
ncbi:ABC transporter permease [Amycolatopsis acidiphila]|uniref:ABC transporter permease n=1 Tax=Amycolatopsis acidiphila TaxID=715473 RepID=A0A558AF95_9PSEU|nr:ABC transporter permease [Amycolatopsis acidiphila]TVT22935.1 ABC transporter permease [Amycolatopsis acidiphila]UIJ57095.1 ABC transporter permease [Amycolatopsis acidiphila]GHG53383.1 ABC transporter permease [Amycolatopsis acidiphila]